MTSSPSDDQGYFCDEPWIGVFAIRANLDVTFCPCYLKQTVGNLKESTMRELWNVEPLVELRRSFSRGELPAACAAQLCPVAVGKPIQQRLPEEGHR
jgi:hypothetical protein